jgi:hypothetical protein
MSVHRPDCAPMMRATPRDIGARRVAATLAITLVHVLLGFALVIGLGARPEDGSGSSAPRAHWAMPRE